MSARTSLQLGFDLARLSDSLTWAHYLRLHPKAKVGFTHGQYGRLYFTLTDAALGHRGVLRYAETVEELIEVAHDALFRDGEVEVM